MDGHIALGHTGRITTASGRGARRTTASLAVTLVLLLTAAACGTGSAASAPSEQDVPAVVVTTTILGDVVTQVVGDGAEVSVLMPVGADPHSFEPSAQQQAQLLEADLIVVSGGGLEPSLSAPLAEAERAGVAVFTAIEHSDPIASDPHFWMDPVRMAEVVRALGLEIDRVAGDDGRVRDQADAYAAQLTALDREIRDLLADLPDDRRTLVTNHDAFGYFAERYDLRIVGTLIPDTSTNAEPSAQDLEELTRTIARERVPAIFTETIASDGLAETLARETGTDVEVVTLFSGSLGEQGSEAATYRSMLRTDAQRISDALS